MKKNLVYLLILAGAAALAYWLYSNDNSSSISKNPLSNFAIEDTASIAAIKIIGLTGDQLMLNRKEDGQWMVNNTWRAAMSPVNLLLETFKSAGVQSTVPVAEIPGVLRHMGSTQTTVKIYGKNDKWIKTWTIGGATKTAQGTYMILETPEEGVSTQPFIVEKRGFRGYLTSRFHTDKEEWRWKGVFIHPDLDIKTISVERPKNPQKSFHISVDDIKTNDVKIYDANSNQVDLPPALLQLYLLEYEKLYVELFDPPLLNDAEEDSVAMRIPDFTITVENTAGQKNSIDLQYKGHPGMQLPEQPLPEDIDPDRLFGVYKDELIQVQRGTWDDILVDIDLLKSMATEK